MASYFASNEEGNECIKNEKKYIYKDKKKQKTLAIEFNLTINETLTQGWLSHFAERD